MSLRPARAEKARLEQHGKHGLVYTCNPNIVRTGARRLLGLAGSSIAQVQWHSRECSDQSRMANLPVHPCMHYSMQTQDTISNMDNSVPSRFFPQLLLSHKFKYFELSSFLFLGAKQTPNGLFKNIVVLK